MERRVKIPASTDKESIFSGAAENGVSGMEGCTALGKRRLFSSILWHVTGEASLETVRTVRSDRDAFCSNSNVSEGRAPSSVADGVQVENRGESLGVGGFALWATERRS